MTGTLPPLPARRIRHVYNESKGYACDAWVEDAVREYAIAVRDAAVADERAKWAAGARVSIPTDAMEQEIAAHVRRAVAAEHADAERYRWLRAKMVKDGDDYECFMSTRGLLDGAWPKNMDAAIDAAMAAARATDPAEKD